jgi:transitional endoplasmic reticulum ATPase
MNRQFTDSELYNVALSTKPNREEVKRIFRNAGYLMDLQRLEQYEKEIDARFKGKEETQLPTQPAKPSRDKIYKGVMGEELELTFDKVEFEHTANVTKMLLPENLSYDEAIYFLRKEIQSQEQVVAVNERIEGFPIDVANALQDTVKKIYGFSELKITPGGFFRPDIPPTFMKVPTDHKGGTKEVFIGRFAIPGCEGFLQTNRDMNDALWVRGELKAKYLPELRKLLAATKQTLRQHSLYRGKAIRVYITEEATGPGEVADTIATPEFLDTENIPANLMLNKETEELLIASVLTPIRKTEMLRKLGIPVRRGALLAGPYGTGKSLTALTVAAECEANGWTFIYLKDIRDLRRMYDFARRYQPAVLFAEDLDIAVNNPSQGDETAININELQNVLDGVDTKNSEVIVILTTNHIDSVPPVLLRPGRLDSAIFFEAPDEETAAKLVIQFGSDLIDLSDFDPIKVGRSLSGQIPATIREVLERAKLHALSHSEDGEIRLNTFDIVYAAQGMKRHLDYVNRPQEAKPSFTEQFGKSVGDHIVVGLSHAMSEKKVTAGYIERAEDKITAPGEV